MRHTFSKKYKLVGSKGTTPNLMDYSSGIELIKYQWDVLHDPQKRLFDWAQSEREGQAESKVYTEGSFVEKFLKKIREANLKHTSNLKMEWKYAKLGFIDNNVQIYENLGFKVGVGVNSSNIKSIKPLMAESDIKIHKNPSFKDIVISIINMFGDYFDVKDYSGVHKILIFRFHEPKTSRYIYTLNGKNLR